MKIKRKLPGNFREEHFCYFSHHLEIILPEMSYQVIKNYCLLFTNGILINRFKVEKQSLLYNLRLTETGRKTFLVKFFLKSLLENKFEFLKGRNTYITIINEWTQNYFHWFTEALPKLVVAINEGFKPVVLLPDSYNLAFQYRSLELLNVEYQTFSANVLIGKGIILPSRLAPFSAQYNPFIMKTLVSLITQPVENGLNKGDRIYISRRAAAKRRVKNEDQVVELLQEFGFCILEAENLNLDEQISIMQHVKIFISIHGAGLTNMIFCKAGTKVLELSLQNQTMDKCYFNLANAMDLIYFYQFCESADSTENYHSSDLIVDIQELKSNLFTLINKND